MNKLNYFINNISLLEGKNIHGLVKPITHNKGTRWQDILATLSTWKI